MPGQYWSLNTAGGYFANSRLSMKLHAQAQPLMRFRQFTDRDTDFGKARGDTLLFDKVFNVTTAGGQLTENVPIPQTSFPVGQGSCVAVEYGNSIPFSEKLETISEFDLSDPIQSRLVDDMAKTINSAVKTQFAASKVYYTPTGTTATPTSSAGFTGSAAAAASRQVQTFDVKEVMDWMKSGVYAPTGTGASTTIVPVPPWDGDNMICIGSVGFCRGIKDDPDWEDSVKYGDPERLFAGEIGRYYSVRFIEENHLLANTIGGYRGEACFFGKEAVKEIVVVPEEIRRGIPMDLGRDRRMGWYAILGFKIIWSYTASTEVENRVVWFQST